MSVSYLLNLELIGYWHPGSGKGSGSHHDAVVEKDRFGCPFISGKMLKGLLRDAVYRAAHWNVYPHEWQLPVADRLVELLFGSTAFSDDATPRNETQAGLLRVDNAQLQESVLHWLGHANQMAQRKELFRDIYATAIDSTAGVAKQGSLRGQQVVIPLELQARIDLEASSLQVEPEELEHITKQAGNVLKTALPLIKAVGANRTRGLGRVNLKLSEVSS